MALEDNSFPAHASPDFPPIHSPQARPQHSRQLSDYRHDPPPSFLSPAITPPSTPGTGTPARLRNATSVPVDTSQPATSAATSGTSASLERITSAPRLMPALPAVRCEVRARIPTTNGQQMFLYLYQNDMDSKEHLAIVFGDHIRSASLDAPRPGETERDRMIRGAYVGRLHPGRTSSRVEQLQREHGVARSSTSSNPSTDSHSHNHNHNHSASADSKTTTTSTVDEPHSPADPSTQAPLVRIHSECYTGETVWSARCDCGEQLDEAQRLMCLPANAAAGGIIIYLRQEGRGIGLGEKLKAYNLQDLGHDTYEANLLLRHPADARSYGLATAMLVDLGAGGDRGIRLLTNNPDKVRAVEGPAREVVVRERVAMVPIAWSSGGTAGVRGTEVEAYLSTKIEKFKHMLDHK